MAFTGLNGCGHRETCRTVQDDHYRFAAPPDPNGEEGSYKMVIDLDGVGPLKRFLHALKVGTAVIKSTIFKEWYSDRIMPWVHYLLLTPTFQELRNLQTYFLGPTIDPNPKGKTRATKPHEGEVTIKGMAKAGRK